MILLPKEHSLETCKFADLNVDTTIVLIIDDLPKANVIALTS
jgi:hypothetical protein